MQPHPAPVATTNGTRREATWPVSAGTLAIPSEWKMYFTRTLSRRSSVSRTLRADILETLRRSIHEDHRVLEVGVGDGSTLAGLPNRVRDGIDWLPEAVAKAKAADGRMRIGLADALTCDLGQKYDAIIADRLVHTVSDVQALLANLQRHLTDDGRIYLTVFNYMWAAPIAVAKGAGIVEPSPEQNWLDESTFANLFRATDLESIRSDDRLLMPLPVPGSSVLNKVVAKLPGFKLGSLYRMYTLRKSEMVRPHAPKVTVVVPARNESGNIQAAIDRTPVMGGGTQLVFVEGGSKDDTAETIKRAIAAYRGPLELTFCQQQGKGKGDAVREGFSRATGDLLMILDADLTVPPEELPKFFDAMVSGRADYVHGNRMVYPMEDEAMRFLNKIGNATFAKMFTYLLDQPIKDTLCGTKVLWRKDWDRLQANRAYFGDFDPFGDFDLIFGANKLQLKLLEIPIRYKNRTYGETNISRFRHGLILLRMSAFAARKLKFV